MTRACPRDGAPLALVKMPNALAGILGPVGDVEVDACGRCRGLFLDAKEFGLLTANMGLDRFLSSKRSGPSGPAPCPGCRKPMTVRALHGVEVDHCASCGGLWFDDGELAKLETMPEPDLGRLG